MPATVNLLLPRPTPTKIDCWPLAENGTSWHLLQEAARRENAGWSAVCLDLLTEAKRDFPTVSWADLVAVAGAVAVEVCGGPAIVDDETTLLDSDKALLDDPELAEWVEVYAKDEPRFFADFADAYYRLTCLGAEQPVAPV